MTNFHRKLWESGHYRVIEHVDEHFDFENLCGDCFNPKVNPHLSIENLNSQRREFRAEVNRAGVYGYELQKWNPDVGCGWEHVDSCWGFVGQYVDIPEHRYNHYIVLELISRGAALERAERKVING
jgi:hypothetical protein